MLQKTSFKIHRVDIAFCGILLILSVLVQHGRMGASIQGLDLTTDVANYAAIAAATAHPEAFAKDDALSDPAIYKAHTTVAIPIIAWLAEGDNYGLAYLKLTGIHVFLHYLTFYVLGLALFKQRWQALIFTVLQGQIYWIFWGTYWGAGYLDYTPRTTFEIFYALYIVAALALLRRPRWWPVFMGAVGLLIYVHSISTLPVALGFFLGFALYCRQCQSDPQKYGISVTLLRRTAWLFFCGLCFLAVAAPLLIQHSAPSPRLSIDDVALLREIQLTRYDAEFTYYWSAIGRFFWHHITLPIFPLALVGAWIVHRFGDEGEKTIIVQFGAWTLGVFGVVALFIFGQETARILNQYHYEFDLVRVLRFLVFFAQCVALMGLCVAMRVIRGWHRYTAALCYAGLCIGLFLGGQQDMFRQSLLWYWNSRTPEHIEAAYAPHLRRLTMLDALKTHTEPGASVFYPREDLAIRYIALRSLTHSWKDVGTFFYAKNVEKLRKWLMTHQKIEATPTSYIEAARHSGADYVLSDRPQDRALLEDLGPVIWEDAGYILLRLAKKSQS